MSASKEIPIARPKILAAVTIETIRERKEPINFKEIIGVDRVLFFGESHSHFALRGYLSREETATALKSAGITHYAVEAPKEGSEKRADLLARLNAGEDIPEDQLLATDVALYPIGQPELDRPETRRGYVRAIKAMVRVGIKIVAVDYAETNTFSGARDEFIASSIQEIIDSDPKTKVAALFGFDHTNKNKSVVLPHAAQILSDRKLRDGSEIGVVTLKVLNDSEQHAGNPWDQPFTVIKSDESLKHEEFVLDVRDEQPYPGADYILYLPSSSEDLVA